MFRVQIYFPRISSGTHPIVHILLRRPLNSHFSIKKGVFFYIIESSQLCFSYIYDMLSTDWLSSGKLLHLIYWEMSGARGPIHVKFLMMYQLLPLSGNKVYVTIYTGSNASLQSILRSLKRITPTLTNTLDSQFPFILFCAVKQCC